jgi:gas vesicle protein
MTKRQRRFDDADFDFGDRRSAGVGTIFLATALGVGIGLLAAPDAGLKTRRRLRKRLETLGGDLGEGLEEMQGLSGRARERMRERLSRMKKRGEDAWEGLEDRWHGEEEEEEDGSGAFGAVIALAAGVAATYFLTSDRAGPARSRVRETAESVRRQATGRWEQYQQHRQDTRGNGQPGASGETRSSAVPSDESPQAS